MMWINTHLNTSYVDIKLLSFSRLKIHLIYLNTSYVDIKQLGFEREYALAIIFKYILC